MEFVDNTKTNTINLEYLEQLKNEHIKEFEKKMILSDLSESDKYKLIKILKFYLDGNLPRKNIATDNIYFDWEEDFNKIKFDKDDILDEKNDEDDLYESFKKFDKLYFDTPKFNTESFPNYDEIILIAINKLKNSYEEFFNIDFEKPNPTEILVKFQKLGENYHNSQLQMQYVILVNKMVKFIEIINIVYPEIIDYKLIHDKLLTKEMGFDDLLNNVTKQIKEHIRNFIKVNISNGLSSKEQNDLLIEVLNVDEKIKSIFWIVYSDDIKFVDNNYRIYNLSESELSDLLENMQEKFNLDGMVDFESDIELITKNIDLYDMIFQNNVQKILNQFDISKSELNQEQIDNILNEQVQLVVSEIQDTNLVELVKSQLEISKGMIKLTNNLDNLFGIITEKIIPNK
jgi:hypothetical protein